MPLTANLKLASAGVIPHGAGMQLTREQAATLEPDAPIKTYRNGKDLTDISRDMRVIDCYGLTAEHVRVRYPKLFQWLLDHVKPEREVNRDKDLREKWWLHLRNNDDMRRALAGLPRYIATVMAAKHRVFQFLDASVLPDQVIVAIGLSDAFHLGVLSSKVHVTWAVALGGRLGVGNDPVYSKSTCFDTFPFPAADTGLTPALQHAISALAGHIDQHRKQVLGLLSSNASSHDHATPLGQALPGAEAIDLPPDKSLTLTGLYNVLQALREGRPLTTKEKHIHSAGLVGVLKTLHDELDAAVLQAYGWSDLAAPATSTTARNAKDELLQRLVTLNQRRAAEETNGTVRWLRQAFQNPLSKTELPTQVQQALEVNLVSNQVTPTTLPEVWPATLPVQVKAVVQVLSRSPGALTLAQIAASFDAGASLKKSLPTLLQTLEALGRAQRVTASGAELWRA